MVGAGTFLVIVVIGLAALGMADQRAPWWRFQAKNLRDPAANEPSASAFRNQRIAFFFGLLRGGLLRGHHHLSVHASRDLTEEARGRRNTWPKASQYRYAATVLLLGGSVRPLNTHA